MKKEVNFWADGPQTGEVEIAGTRNNFAGYGHRELGVEVQYIVLRRAFTTTTTDMPFTDSLQDMDCQAEVDAAIVDKIWDGLQDSVAEWMGDVYETTHT